MQYFSFSILLCLVNFSIFGQECPGQHCSAKAPIVNLMCKQLGNQGRPVFVEHNGSYCWCKCSCLASATPVETTAGSWKPIGEIKVGETVLAIDATGKWNKATVVFSDGSNKPEKPFPYAIYVVTDNNVTLIVTPEHLFLMPDNTLKRADRLAPNDRLLDKDKVPRRIVTLTSGNYHGPIHHIATTNWNEQNASISGHLINTSGIISADYFAELFLQPMALLSSPQVGTTEYLKHHKLSAAPGAMAMKDTIQFSETTSFIPYKQKAEPSGALYFLPPGLDIAKEGTLLPLDNTLPYEMALYLADHFKVYYPNINFHVEWNDTRVNAFAWMQGSQRHVSILGGLLRHNAIKLEGASLVLAHEIGHHLGGPPRYPNNTWASCEGQADYWGSLVGMRRVWFGQYAMENTDKGATQLYNLFAFGLKQNLLTLDWEDYKKKNNLAGICTHPAALCRLETYRAAMKADPKPACAGDSQ